MGVSSNVVFADAPLARVEAAVKGVVSGCEAAVAGFPGAPGWTCLLAAPRDLWTADAGARLGALSRAIGAECFAFDAYDGDSMRVMSARGRRVTRAGYLSDELDAGMEFDGAMTLPVLNDVTIAGAVAWARKTYPHDRVWRFDGGAARQVPPADVIEAMAREDVADVQAAVKAIAMVFGGDRHALVDSETISECLIRRARPLVVTDDTPSFTFFTRA